MASLGAPGLPEFNEAKFPLGLLLMTPGARDALTPLDMKRGLFWHSQRYWGDVSEEDQEANDRAILDGGRILSAYVADNGTRFWLITEADRSATTILLPDEY